jgi:hypothetical protein
MHIDSDIKYTGVVVLRVVLRIPYSGNPCPESQMKNWKTVSLSLLGVLRKSTVSLISVFRLQILIPASSTTFMYCVPVGTILLSTDHHSGPL